MLLRWSPLIFAVGLLCQTSAFTTQFITEDVGVQQAKGEKEMKREENNTVQSQPSAQNVEVKIIPIVADGFIQSEDLLSMTPLKLVTAISAEYLLNAVRNIPLKGNSAQDVLEMLGGVVKEINKTAAIIKLTAEYVNVSSHYMMSALEQLNESNCEKDVFEESVKSLRKSFYKSIAEHVGRSVKELFEKTREREVTGNDILITSAYHIVTSFQEMTNEVVSLTKEAYKKCNSPLPSLELSSTNVENPNTTQINDDITVEVIPGQGKVHKSIKKDQATTKPEISVTVDSPDNNQDLTIEVLSPDVLMQNPLSSGVSRSQENKPVQYLQVARLPLLKAVSLFSNSGSEDDSARARKDQELGLRVTQQETKKNEIDKELASSAVDSLSNVPWESSEPEGKSLDKTFVLSDSQKSPQSLWNILQLLAPNYKQLSISQCDDNVVPVCGIDDSIQKFIIFVNDCKREAYNKQYGTRYYKSNLDTCLQYFLLNHQQDASSSQTNQRNNVDLRPR